MTVDKRKQKETVHHFHIVQFEENKEKKGAG